MRRKTRCNGWTRCSRTVNVPVGVGTFGVEDAVRAASKGADLVAIGHPVIGSPNATSELREFVREVRANYRPRVKK